MPKRLSPDRSRPACRSTASASPPQLVDELRSSRSRSATRSSCGSRSASSAASRRGTTRCTRSPPRSRPRSPPAAPSCSSRARSRRSTRSSSPRSSTRSACPPACSTSSPASARSSARRSPRTPTSTWCRSPARPAPASGSAELGAADGQAGRARARRQVGRTSSSTTPTSTKAVADGVGKLLPQLGPDLLGAHPHARAARSRWPRSRRIAARGGRDVHARRPVRRRRRTLGPLVSAAQRDRVRGYIQKGIDEGATLVTGGADAPEGLDKGYFVQPTVFSDVTPRHDHRAGGDLRPGAVDHPLRRRGRRGRDRQRHRLRPRRRRVVRRRRAGQGRRPQIRTGQVEVNGGGVQPDGAVRRLQAVGQRPRARQVRPRGVPRGEVAPA